MNLNQYADDCNDIAVRHGWWDKPRNVLELSALVMTELAEMCEAARVDDTENLKEEMADVFIRMFDMFRGLFPDGDLDKEVTDKMEYNKTRPYRHGNKQF